MSMSSTNKLSYNYSNGLYVSYPIDGEKINVIALYFTLEFVQRLLVKASHSGSNLASNITHFEKILLMWQVINER